MLHSRDRRARPPCVESVQRTSPRHEEGDRYGAIELLGHPPGPGLRRPPDVDVLSVLAKNDDASRYGGDRIAIKTIDLVISHRRCVALGSRTRRCGCADHHDRSNRIVRVTFRVNRSSILWLAARRKATARSAALHLDCARLPQRGRVWIHVGISCSLSLSGSRRELVNLRILAAIRPVVQGVVNWPDPKL